MAAGAGPGRERLEARLIVTLTMNPALDVSTSTAAVRPTDKLRCSTPGFEPGGGGINVARVVHALGGEVLALFPSGGPAGATLCHLLQAAGLRFRAIPIGGATRESLTVDEEESGEQYRFVLPGPELTAAEQAECLRAVEAAAPPSGFVVASGSLPPGAPADFYATLGAACGARGARFVLDTSGAALRHGPGARAYLLKPNLREAEELLGTAIRGEAAEESAAREMVERGFARVVVISLGSRGAVFADGSAAGRLPPIAVEAKSAVGAGDSMVAGIVLGLDRGLAVAEAVRLGQAAGAAALLTPGSGLARRADVERLFGASLPAPPRPAPGPE